MRVRSPFGIRGACGLLCTILILQILMPLTIVDQTSESLTDASVISPSVSFNDGNSHEFAGDNIDYEGLLQASVRDESVLDYWMEMNILSPQNTTSIGTPDVVLNKDESVSLCWSESDGDIHYAHVEKNGNVTSSVVDTVTLRDGIVDCAIMLTEHGKPRVLYADGNHLKSARFVVQDSIYAQDGWNIRTMREYINATDIEMVSVNDKEWSVVRDNNGVLWRVNFTGILWQEAVLDRGPVGQDFELAVDGDNVTHVVYFRDDLNEVRLVRVDGQETTKTVLSRGSTLSSVIGMSLDGDNLEQVATVNQLNNSFTIELLRSLVGQDTGRISPNPSSVYISANDVEESNLLSADFDSDGFTEIIESRPFADSQNNTSAGAVYITSTNASGITNQVQIIHGESDNSNLGYSIAVGDYNGDTYDDLAIGAPGDSRVDIYLGSSAGLANNSSQSLYGNASDEFGADLETIADADMDGDEELAILSSNVTFVLPQGNQTGQVTVYYGGSAMTFGRNITQTSEGPFFGRSIAGGGDLNGDGLGDLVITNTGTEQNPQGYSSVEIFYASNTSGFSGSPDYILLSNAQGRLFGGQAEMIGDINADGYDELLISELYNQTSGVYLSGKVILVEGGEGIQSSPFWTKTGVTANEMLGTNFAPAGDVNEDGYDDLLIASREADRSGRIDLILGGPDGFRTDVQTLMSGASSQENLGILISTGFDIDGDGLGEIAVSKRDTSQGQNFLAQYQFHEKRDWESLEFSENGELLQLEVGIASRGETSLLYTTQIDNQTVLTHYEHTEDTTPTGKWVSHQPYGFSAEGNISYTVTSAGKPLIFTSSDEDGIKFVTSNGYVALEQELVSSGSFGDYLGSAIDANGNQYVAVATNAAQQIYMFTRGPSSWNSELVISQTTLTENPSVMVADNGTIYMTYRDSTSDELKLVYKSSSSWAIGTIGTSGNVVSEKSPSLLNQNGEIITALIDSDGNNSTLSVWSFDHNNTTFDSITSLTDQQSDIDIAIRDDGEIFVSVLDSVGNLNVYSKSSNSTNWTSNSLPKANGSLGQFMADLEISDEVVIAISGTNNEYPLHTFDGNWSSHRAPSPQSSGAYDLVIDSGRILLFTTSTNGNLEWNSFDERLNDWRTVELGDLRAGSEINAQIHNGTIFTTLFDNVDMDVDLLRFYHDTDRDLVFDAIDQLPEIGNQWQDTDGDGAGDNPDGPYSDYCPSSAGPSTYYAIGCPDSDNDGFPDVIDDCPGESDLSYFDRYGCRDTDQDGWSSNRQSWYSGDVFDRNWKQVFDSDGDGYGDNSGPDCCVTSHSSQDDAVPDLFPYNPSQYRDTDGDGFGDNKSDTLTGDECPWDYGVSFRDRRGCIDSDGDGSSDPEPDGFPFPWLVEDGADMWPNDPTQWADSDGDGYGDNSSAGATNPDKFPTNIAAAVDSDEDGFPDNWTSNYTGNNSGGLELDGCPGVFGTSSFNTITYEVLGSQRTKTSYPGCPDADGDGWSNTADDMPYEPTQFLDSDNDGFGDNSAGVNPDACPYVQGVVNGTEGDGCPIIIADDEDGDGVYDSADNCPSTPNGVPVDSSGCADSQRDTDGDGVTDDIDLCEDTESGSQVDSTGCTDEQNLADSDSDGVLDPQDACPGTASNESVDENGCSINQRDSDSDGVVDSEDLCPDTAEGYPVDSTGCVDDSQLETDLDGDGYFGNYTYVLNNETGLRENQTGDAFPLEATQHSDQDGDGFGDNQFGVNSDYCPTEFGNSTIAYRGCPDDDGDGYWNFKDSFPDEPTQWEDEDGDFVGDNPNGTNPDLCPDTLSGWQDTVNEDGCASNERDTDGDGLDDFTDPCPLQSGIGGSFGCPAEPEEEEPFEFMGFGLPILIGGSVGILVVLILIVVVVGRLLSGRIDLDDDEDDDDYYDDEDDEDDFMSSFGSSTRATPQRSMPSRANTPNAPPRSSPKSAPSRGPPGASRAGPPGRSPSQGQTSPRPQSGPPRSGPQSAPSRGPPGASRSGPPGSNVQVSNAPRESSSEAKVSKKKSVKQVAGKKVRKAAIKVDLSVFEAGQEADRKLAVDWTIEAITQGEQERVILMQLQQTGWNAEQSRAIISLARNQ